MEFEFKRELPEPVRGPVEGLPGASPRFLAQALDNTDPMAEESTSMNPCQCGGNST